MTEHDGVDRGGRAGPDLAPQPFRMTGGTWGRNNARSGWPDEDRTIHFGQPPPFGPADGPPAVGLPGDPLTAGYRVPPAAPATVPRAGPGWLIAGYWVVLSACLLLSLTWLVVGGVVGIAAGSPDLAARLSAAAAAGNAWAQGIVDAVGRSEPVAQAVLDYSFSLLALLLALALAVRRGRSWSTRLLVLALVGSAGAFNLQAHAAATAVESATGLSIGGLHQILLHGVACAAYILALLVFPPGQPGTRRADTARAVLAAAAAGTLLLVGFGTALLPHTASCVLFFGFGVPIAGLLAVPRRVRRGATDEQRTQARLLLSVLLAAVVIAVVLAIVSVLVWSIGWAGLTLVDPTAHGEDIGLPLALLFWFSRLASVGIAGAVLVATRSGGLLTAERLFSRGLVTALVAALVGGGYVAVHTVVAIAMGDSPNAAAVSAAVSVAVCAVGFLPAYVGTEKVVDRLLYGTRPTPYSVLAGIAALSRSTAADAPDLARVAEAVGRGLGASTCRLTVIRPGLRDRAYTWSEAGTSPSDALTEVAVRHGEERIGTIAVDRAAVAGLQVQRQHLLTDIADSLGAVLQASRYSIELERQLRAALAHAEEIAESRRAAVAEMDGERRRIERDLHDGAQHHLVSLRLTLGLVEHLVKTEKFDQARERLQLVGEQLGNAEAILAETASGVASPLLSEHGLIGALQRELEGGTPPVGVDAAGVPAGRRFSADVEAAVWFCCLEAVNNARKHAAGAPVTVTLAQRGGELHFAVRDEGPGWDQSADQGGPGRGMRNLVARISPVGGRVRVRSRPGAGTTVEGAVPVPAEPAETDETVRFTAAGQRRKDGAPAASPAPVSERPAAAGVASGRTQPVGVPATTGLSERPVPADGRVPGWSAPSLSAAVGEPGRAPEAGEPAGDAGSDAPDAAVGGGQGVGEPGWAAGLLAAAGVTPQAEQMPPAADQVPAASDAGAAAEPAGDRGATDAASDEAVPSWADGLLAASGGGRVEDVAAPPVDAATDDVDAAPAAPAGEGVPSWAAGLVAASGGGRIEEFAAPPADAADDDVDAEPTAPAGWADALLAASAGGRAEDDTAPPAGAARDADVDAAPTAAAGEGVPSSAAGLVAASRADGTDRGAQAPGPQPGAHDPDSGDSRQPAGPGASPEPAEPREPFGTDRIGAEPGAAEAGTAASWADSLLAASGEAGADRVAPSSAAAGGDVEPDADEGPTRAAPLPTVAAGEAERAAAPGDDEAARSGDERVQGAEPAGTAPGWADALLAASGGAGRSAAPDEVAAEGPGEGVPGGVGPGWADSLLAASGAGGADRGARHDEDETTTGGPGEEASGAAAVGAGSSWGDALLAAAGPGTTDRTDGTADDTAAGETGWAAALLAAGASPSSPSVRGEDVPEEPWQPEPADRSRDPGATAVPGFRPDGSPAEPEPATGPPSWADSLLGVAGAAPPVGPPSAPTAPAVQPDAPDMTRGDTPTPNTPTPTGLPAHTPPAAPHRPTEATRAPQPTGDTLLDRVRSVVETAVRAYRATEHEERLRLLARRLDEPLRLGIAGPAGAGSSTLAEALLGYPTGPAPASTAVPVWWRHGEPAVAAVPFDGAPVGLAGPWLADPAAVAYTERIEARVPIPVLGGLTVIDLPGLGPGDPGRRAHELLDPAESVVDVLLLVLRAGRPEDATAFGLLHSGGSAHGRAQAIGVLTRVDELGSRLDPVAAARAAEEAAARPAMRWLCRTVVGVSGLAARGAATLTDADVQALAAAGEDAAVPPGLAARLGPAGIATARELVAERARPTAADVAAALVDASGLSRLRELVDVRFVRRNAPLKARSALRRLEELVRRDPPPGGGRDLFYELERVHAGAHELAEIDLIDAIGSGLLAVPPDEAGQAEQLLGLTGTEPWARLGLGPGAPDAEVARVAAERLAHWQRRASHPASTQAVRTVAAVLVRSCEALVAGATTNSRA